MTLGELSLSVLSGRRAIEFADRSEDAFHRISELTTTADALHQHGEPAEAHELFAQAEEMQAERQPQFELLYSLWGFRFCDLLLAHAERAAWAILCERQDASPGSEHSPATDPTGASALRLMSPLDACQEVTRRAPQTLEWAIPQNFILDIALEHLTLARSSLYRAILESSRQPTADTLAQIAPELDKALN